MGRRRLPSIIVTSQKKFNMTFDIDRLFGRHKEETTIPKEEYSSSKHFNPDGLGKIFSPEAELAKTITQQDFDDVRASAGNAEHGMYILGQHVAKLEGLVEELQRRLGVK